MQRAARERSLACAFPGIEHGMFIYSREYTRTYTQRKYIRTCVYDEYVLIKNESECSETPVRGLIGCHKLQVISRKRVTNYRALLRPVRGLLPVLSPVLNMVCLWVRTYTNIHTYKENMYVHVYMTNM